jgi:hypothetical protein
MFRGRTLRLVQPCPRTERCYEFIILLGLAYVAAGRYLGLGRWWERAPVVRRNPILM